MAYLGGGEIRGASACPLDRPQTLAAIGCRSGRPDARDLSDAIALEAIFPIGEVEESFCYRKTADLI
jgi:hypothetical protein